MSKQVKKTNIKVENANPKKKTLITKKEPIIIVNKNKAEPVKKAESIKKAELIEDAVDAVDEAEPVDAVEEDVEANADIVENNIEQTKIEPIKKIATKGLKQKEVKQKVKPIEIKEDDNKEILLDLSKIKNKKAKKIEKVDNNSNELFNEEDLDFRFVLLNYDYTKNKTLPKITKYEKALLIGKRAKQIEEGANPNVKVLPGQTAIEIAEEELRQRKIPLIIKRPLGNIFEYWKPADMEVLMD
jgi:DNA-directed RNA polymerase I, II, and III subunit RPABC2